MGRQRGFATFRGIRLTVDLSRSSVGTRERLHPPISICMTPLAKVKFQEDRSFAQKVATGSFGSKAHFQVRH